MKYGGNFTIWKEILTFDIQTYKNGGKCVNFPGKKK